MINLGSLNPQQRLAVETIHGPVLILAGAGTGKTRVITFRIAHMIAEGVAPGQILAVTFTNKAAREMQERVRQLLPKQKAAPDGRKPEKPTICTFHALCVRILRQHIEKLGYKKNFVIYSETDQLGAIKKILSNISSKAEKIDPNKVLGFISRIKNAGFAAAAKIDPDMTALAERLRGRYESALRACNAVDFDDLILLTLKLFQEHEAALEACRKKYQYVMVDEYQDTNAAQFQLVHALACEHRNFCVVGDDDQSIYGWRGAEIANLLNLEEHYPEVKIIKLEQNYRSTNTILNAANAVIKNNLLRRGKQLWSQKGNGEKIVLHAFKDDEEEAATIVDEIEFRRMAHRAPWKEQAILFRTNLQSRPIETALRKASVRYHLIGGQSFFDRREIKDFLSFIKMFVNPDDDISLLRIANIPPRGLSDVTMERLLGASHERSCSVHAAMKNPLVQMTLAARTREAVSEFLQLIEKYRSMLINVPSYDLKAWIENFLDEIKFYEELKRSEKEPEVAENRIQNIRELIVDLGRAGAKEDSALERLQLFLDDVSLDNDRSDDKELEGDAVTLITMHSCKGLEFPHVYIVGVEEGILPHTRSKVEGTLDEERRLFYVGITRAMHSLTLSHCESRRKYGEFLTCHPSRFLSELPKGLIEAGDAKSSQPVAVNSGKSLFESMRAAVE
jgi:superfamily I DNA/RNA helicase